MENTNGLQRGNLIATNDKYYLDSIFEIEIITRTGITTSQMIVPEKRIQYQGFGVEQIVPLSITPETLNLFEGFEFTETTVKQEFGIIEFFFNIRRGISQFWVGGLSICSPTSIHQLQNIISSLTGEQLKLK